MAYLADLTREENRAKSMAVIGITIGASFVFSLILGPALQGLIGVPGIFWLTAAGALVATGLVLAGLPKPTGALPVSAAGGEFHRILRDGQMMRLNAGVFVLHFAMTAIFVALPHEIVVHENLSVSSHWKIYLPTMLAGFVLMVPFLRGANRPGHSRRALLVGMAALVVAEAMLAFGRTNTLGLGIALTVFFAGFSLLEAMQPSLVSRLAPGRARGAASGVYATAQFLGAFAGGAAGGALLSVSDATSVFVVVGSVLLIYLIATFSMPEPRLFATRELRVGTQSPRDAEALATRLAAIPGVMEAIVMGEVGVAYLKIDDRVLDPATLVPFAVAS
jgi:predicted MFS family arabinose efflux permease